MLHPDFSIPLDSPNTKVVFLFISLIYFEALSNRSVCISSGNASFPRVSINYTPRHIINDIVHYRRANDRHSFLVLVDICILFFCNIKAYDLTIIIIMNDGREKCLLCIFFHCIFIVDRRRYFELFNCHSFWNNKMNGVLFTIIIQSCMVTKIIFIFRL